MSNKNRLPQNTVDKAETTLVTVEDSTTETRRVKGVQREKRFNIVDKNQGRYGKVAIN